MVGLHCSSIPISLKYKDEKLVTARILFDLAKAFSSVNHTFLLTKPSNVGVPPGVVNWFESYMTGRTQRDRIVSSPCFFWTRYRSLSLSMS